MSVDLLHRRLTDATFRCVDDAFEFQVMCRVHHHLEISDGILDLCALVKAWATDYPVGNTKSYEPVFKGSHLERSAHKDRGFVQVELTFLKLFDIFGNFTRFLFVIPHTLDGNFFPIANVREQGFAETAFVVPYQVGCRSEDMTC